MAEVQLQPDELDRLEDALEDLELDDLLDDPSPAVRSRLADYRVILMASREALPMVDVPPGVLAGVLAEARRTDDELVELSAADADGARTRESWWSRVRKSFLIPTLAVVGTAALILIIVTPTMTMAPAEDVEVVARVETPAHGGQAAQGQPPQMMPPTPAEASPEPAAQAPGDAAAADGGEAEAEDAPVYEIATARRPNSDKANDAEKAVAGAPAAGKDEAAANAEESPATEAERQDSPAASWEAIERGDKARLGGDCFRASNEYHRALDDGNDSVRARALVGLGLCAAEDGNAARAKSYYEEARALDPEVGGYIDTQSNDDTLKPRKAPPRKKDSSKRKASMPSPQPQSQSLPGDARNANPFKD